MTLKMYKESNLGVQKKDALCCCFLIHKGISQDLPLLYMYCVCGYIMYVCVLVTNCTVALVMILLKGLIEEVCAKLTKKCIVKELSSHFSATIVSKPRFSLN